MELYRLPLTTLALPLLVLALLIHRSESQSEIASTTATPEPVNLTIWTFPNRDWHNELLMSVKEIVNRLMDQDKVLIFEPEIYIHNGKIFCHDVGKDCSEQCLYDGRYCQENMGAENDEHYKDVMGATIVTESARRMCIWQIANDQYSSPMLYFQYLKELEASGCDAKLTTDCLNVVYTKLGFSAADVDKCIYGTADGSDNSNQDTTNKILQRQADLEATLSFGHESLPKVLINGQDALKDQDLSTATIFQAICKFFSAESTPEACSVCLDQCEASATDSHLDACLYDLACQKEEDWEKETDASASPDASPTPADAATAPTTIVTLSIYTSPNRDWHNELFKSVKEIVNRLMYQDHVLIFDPEMCVHDAHIFCHDIGKDCSEHCLYVGRYCQMNFGEEPEEYLNVLGHRVVTESLRRQCIWEIASKQYANPMIYFQYLEELEASGCDTQQTTECLDAVYDKLGLHALEVNQCAYGTPDGSDNSNQDMKNTMLERQVALQGKIPSVEQRLPRVLINGEEVLQDEEQELTTASIFQALCQAYPKESLPEACTVCLEQCEASDETSNVESCLKDLICHAEDAWEKGGEEETDNNSVEGTETQQSEEDGVAASSPSGEEKEEDVETEENEEDVETEEPQLEESAAATPLPSTAPSVLPSAAPSALSSTAAEPTDETAEAPEVEAETSTSATQESVAETTTTTPSIPGAANDEPAASSAQDAASQHDATSGFAKLTDLLGTRNIYSYQILQACGVDFNDPGPLVTAIQKDDLAAFVSGADSCSDDGSKQFVEACGGFEQCAGFDFLEFAETNSHALGKSFFGCLKALSDNANDLDVAIERCMGLVFNTGLYNSVAHFLEYSDKICPCLTTLQRKTPECVFQRDTDDDPIALDGPAIKLSTCVLGELCKKADSLCKEEVTDLNKCLPPEGDKSKSCETIDTECKQQGALLFLSPPPLAGAIFPNRCQQIASKGKKEFRDAHIIARYNAYRQQCVLKSEDSSPRDFGSPDLPSADTPKNGTAPLLFLKGLIDSQPQSNLLLGAVAMLAFVSMVMGVCIGLCCCRRANPRHRYRKMDKPHDEDDDDEYSDEDEEGDEEGERHEPYRDDFDDEEGH